MVEAAKAEGVSVHQISATEAAHNEWLAEAKTAALRFGDLISSVTTQVFNWARDALKWSNVMTTPR